MFIKRILNVASYTPPLSKYCPCLLYPIVILVTICSFDNTNISNRFQKSNILLLNTIFSWQLIRLYVFFSQLGYTSTLHIKLTFQCLQYPWMQTFFQCFTTTSLTFHYLNPTTSHEHFINGTRSIKTHL
jgi:hypothetical protein